MAAWRPSLGRPAATPTERRTDRGCGSRDRSDAALPGPPRHTAPHPFLCTRGTGDGLPPVFGAQSLSASYRGRRFHFRCEIGSARLDHVDTRQCPRSGDGGCKFGSAVRQPLSFPEKCWVSTSSSLLSGNRHYRRAGYPADRSEAKELAIANDSCHTLSHFLLHRSGI